MGDFLSHAVYLWWMTHWINEIKPYQPYHNFVCRKQPFMYSWFCSHKKLLLLLKFVFSVAIFFLKKWRQAWLTTPKSKQLCRLGFHLCFLISEEKKCNFISIGAGVSLEIIKWEIMKAGWHFNIFDSRKKGVMREL